MRHIMKCAVCGKYTLQEICCAVAAQEVGPAKFSPQDPYANYRRKVKQEEYKKRGLL